MKLKDEVTVITGGVRDIGKSMCLSTLPVAWLPEKLLMKRMKHHF